VNVIVPLPLLEIRDLARFECAWRSHNNSTAAGTLIRNEIEFSLAIFFARFR